MRKGEGGHLPEPCRPPQFGKTPLHVAARYGYAAVVEQLLAAGAAVDAKDKVWGVGGHGGGRVGWQNTAPRIYPLGFLVLYFSDLGSRSLPGSVQELVTSLRFKRGNMTDSPANHHKEI